MQLNKRLPRLLSIKSERRRRSYTSLLVVLAISTSAGCAARAVSVAPREVPNPSIQAAAQLLHLVCKEGDDRLWQHRACLRDEDPLTEYLAEIENYRDYIEVLRSPK